MAIGVRDITNLEELLEVQDDDKIIVIQNGEAKLISKANAKFGGGTVTVFYSETFSSPSVPIGLADVNGNPISAQAAYNAVMSGPVYIVVNAEDNDAFLVPIMFGAMKTGAEIVSVIFIAKMHGTTLNFYAGLNPNEVGGNA